MMLPSKAVARSIASGFQVWRIAARQMAQRRDAAGLAWPPVWPVCKNPQCDRGKCNLSYERPVLKL